MTSFDAIVLAGGTSRRMNGIDKCDIEIGGTTLLDRAVSSVAAAERIVVVGPVRDLSRPVTWTREDPPGAGPVSAIAAAFAVLAREASIAEDLSRNPIVLLPGDAPFAGPAIIRLLAATHSQQVALLTDAGGRDQYLLAAWQRRVLSAQLAKLASFAGVSMRRLYEGASAVRIPSEGSETLDCDTPADIKLARQFVKGA